VVPAAVVLICLALLSLTHVRVRTNPLQFLPGDHPTVRDYAAVGGRIGGFYTMEIVVDVAETWWEPRVASVLDGLGKSVEAASIVPRVVSPLDFLKQARRWEHGLAEGEYRLPESASEARMLLASLEGPAQEALAELTGADGRRVRLSALVAEMDEARFLSLVAETEARLEALPTGYSGYVTGQVLRLVRAQQSLVGAQVHSLGLALGLVLVCVGLGLRSWRLTALAILPNALPVVAVFALMALLAWPLDPATLMVASIALGIAVDNTAHVLAHVRAARAGGESWQRAAGIAVGRVAPAMLVTTLTAGIGFLSLAGSYFVPIRALGILASAAMVVALVGDLVLLPSMIVLGRRR
jgi:predicted RND superfamily exporter protein